MGVSITSAMIISILIISILVIFINQSVLIMILTMVELAHIVTEACHRDSTEYRDSHWSVFVVAYVAAISSQNY